MGMDVCVCVRVCVSVSMCSGYMVIGGVSDSVCLCFCMHVCACARECMYLLFAVCDLVGGIVALIALPLAAHSLASAEKVSNVGVTN